MKSQQNLIEIVTRPDLVQTEEQYVFIHDAIVEAIRSGNTEICKEELSGYVEGLTQPIPVKTRQSGSKSDKKVAAGDEDHDEGGGDKDGGADKSGTTSGDLMLMVDPGDPAIGLVNSSILFLFAFFTIKEIVVNGFSCCLQSDLFYLPILK